MPDDNYSEDVYSEVKEEPLTPPQQTKKSANSDEIEIGDGEVEYENDFDDPERNALVNREQEQVVSEEEVYSLNSKATEEQKQKSDDQYSEE